MTATTQESMLDPLRDGLARMIMSKVAGPDPRLCARQGPQPARA